ncbi:ubiquitin carboxyl-terminal hydrolase 3 isoform X3 [Hemicordylus capensis]|uniref:ubiquitin carboxyl-terminal hydrolase 3 isoform X3 n=1 Tax=Hemicordylus capensis TaxID=884348 RepID=UPI002302488C|nr:ubiquitin carboxyl-terminal hydrolase 3 isoform X3 [Hemicordylus capensis]
MRAPGVAPPPRPAGSPNGVLPECLAVSAPGPARRTPDSSAGWSGAGWWKRSSPEERGAACCCCCCCRWGRGGRLPQSPAERAAVGQARPSRRGWWGERGEAGGSLARPAQEVARVLCSPGGGGGGVPSATFPGRSSAGKPSLGLCKRRQPSISGRFAIPKVCRSNKSPWVCLTCSSVHCGRYVNGHAKKHYEDAQIPLTNHKKSEKQEKAQHTVCMDCSSYSTYCYRCDDFVVNDTKLGLVQKVREHLQNLENSAFTADRHRKRKLLENSSLNSKLLKINGSTTTLCATGLRNLGNTCFMNAILQSLSNIQQFCCYFKELPAVELRNGKTAGRRTYHTRSQGDNGVSLVEEFRKTLCALWQGSQTAFSPESLFYVIWKIMPNFRNGTSTVVTAIFGGILQNEVNCLICGTESRKFDPFLDLSLDIPSQFRNKRKTQENGPLCTLRDCLRSFTDLEELDETELYMCHKCKKKQKSTKKFWIQKLPKVLCLHLKRFHWTAYLRNKVDTYVEFPLRGLDMKCYLLEPENSVPGSCLYDLAAVVVHHGSGVGSGHYTAYATHDGRWFHFNDSTVTLTDEETVVKAKAYILFYVDRQAKSGTSKL